MLCDNDELEVHASHKHGVHCKYFQCYKVFCCVLFQCTLGIWLLSEVSDGVGGHTLWQRWVGNSRLKTSIVWTANISNPKNTFFAVFHFPKHFGHSSTEEYLYFGRGHFMLCDKDKLEVHAYESKNVLILIKFKLSPHFILQVQVENLTYQKKNAIWPVFTTSSLPLQAKHCNSSALRTSKCQEYSGKMT